MTKPHSPITPLDLDSIATRPLPGTRSIVSPKFTEDGQFLYYLYAREGQALELFECITQTGELRVLDLDIQSPLTRTLEEELRRERLRITWEGLADFELMSTPRGAAILLNSAGRYSVVDASTHSVLIHLADYDLLRVITASARGSVIGTTGASIIEFPLRGEPTTTIISSTQARVTYGVAEYVAQEELDRLEGMWLSPNERFLAFAEVDESEVEDFAIAHHLGDPTVETHRYPFVGANNARVKVAIYNFDDKSTAWLEIPGEEIYLARVAWSQNNTLTMGVLNRAQTRLRWYQYSPEAGLLRQIWKEKGEPWINLPPAIIPMGGDEMLVTSEETGFAHLRRIGGVNPSEPLTKGDFMITSIAAVNASTKQAWVTATAVSPLQRHVYVVNLETGDLSRLTQDAGFHDVVVSVKGGYFVDQHSSLQRGEGALLKTTEGRVIATLGEPAPFARDLGLTPPRLIEIPTRDGAVLHGALYLPPDGVTQGRPGVIAVYGGPRAQTVQDSWGLTVDLQSQYLAAAGAIVLKVDGRGSYYRGKAFEAPIFRAMGSIEIADQILAAKFMITELGVDSTGLGVYGWSYGGYATLQLLAQAPELFRVGVAGAPVSDMALYDSAYTERYMQTPAANPEGYSAADVLGGLDKLSAPLLIIHGLIDENVHFRHSARILNSLANRGKDVDLLLLPESRHAPRGFETLREITRRRSQFLLGHLGLAPPPPQ